MGKNIYLIQQELEDLILKFEEGEASDEDIAKFEATQSDFVEKLNNYRLVIQDAKDKVDNSKNEITRLQGYKKTKDKLIERLTNVCKEAVIKFGNQGKSGNMVFEGNNFKMYTKDSSSVILNEPLIAVIISAAREYLGELLENNITSHIDLPYLANIINNIIMSDDSTKYLLEKPSNFENISDLENTKEYYVITENDLAAININVVHSCKLSYLFDGNHEHVIKQLDSDYTNTEIKTNIDKTSMKYFIDNLGVVVASKEINTSLIIK